MEYMELEIRDIRTHHVNQHVKVKGVVLKSEYQYPFYKTLALKCTKCENIEYCKQVVVEPSIIPKLHSKYCQNEICKKKGFFEIVEAESTIIDVQEIEIGKEYAEKKGDHVSQYVRKMRVFLLEDTVGKAEDQGGYEFYGYISTVKNQLGKFEFVLIAEAVEPIPLSEIYCPDITIEKLDTKAQKLDSILKYIKEIQSNSSDNSASYELVLTKAESAGFDKMEAMNVITELRRQGYVYQTGSSKLRSVSSFLTELRTDKF